MLRTVGDGCAPGVPKCALPLRRVIASGAVRAGGFLVFWTPLCGNFRMQGSEVVDPRIYVPTRALTAANTTLGAGLYHRFPFVPRRAYPLGAHVGAFGHLVRALGVIR